MKNIIVDLNALLYKEGFFNFMSYIKDSSIHCYFFDDTINPFLSINMENNELKVNPLYVNSDYYSEILNLLKQYKQFMIIAFYLQGAIIFIVNKRYRGGSIYVQIFSLFIKAYGI